MSKQLGPNILTHEAGFSLVEMMIVVAIIGVLSAMAVPQFQRFQARAKQTEAKTNITHIATLQETYQGDNDQYWDGFGIWDRTLPVLGFSVPANSRYIYGTAATGGYYLIGSQAANPQSIRPGCVFDSWWTDSTRRIWSGGDCAVDP